MFQLLQWKQAFLPIFLHAHKSWLLKEAHKHQNTVSANACQRDQRDLDITYSINHFVCCNFSLGAAIAQRHSIRLPSERLGDSSMTSE